jgi:hypothetical protein
MVTANLVHARHIATAGATVIALSTVGVAIGGGDARLAGTTPPHPTLTGSVADALSILQNNLRVLAAPYLLWLLRFHRHRLGRRAGDLLIFVVTAHSTLPVGIELARWHTRLLPYLPQLPLEWGALSVAVSASLTIRSGTTTRRHVALLAGLTAVLLLAAASLETWGTPHRPVVAASRQLRADGIQGGPLSCECPGVAFATDFAPGRPGHFKVARSLPLTALGSARQNPGADRAPSTTPGPPQGGTTT